VKAFLLTLFDYSYWATDQILAAAKRLSPEEFVAPSDITCFLQPLLAGGPEPFGLRSKVARVAPTQRSPSPRRVDLVDELSVVLGHGRCQRRISLKIGTISGDDSDERGESMQFHLTSCRESLLTFRARNVAESVSLVHAKPGWPGRTGELIGGDVRPARARSGPAPGGAKVGRGNLA
jgi:hypothetical protein